MTQKFSFEGNTITFCLYREDGWGQTLKIGIIILKKKKYLFGEALVPIQFTVMICKQDCSSCWALIPTRSGTTAFPHSPLNDFKENILKSDK